MCGVNGVPDLSSNSYVVGPRTIRSKSAAGKAPLCSQCKEQLWYLLQIVASMQIPVAILEIGDFQSEGLKNPILSMCSNLDQDWAPLQLGLKKRSSVFSVLIHVS